MGLISAPHKVWVYDDDVINVSTNTAYYADAKDETFDFEILMTDMFSYWKDKGMMK